MQERYTTLEMMVSTKTLNEVKNKSKFDWIISINGLTRFLSIIIVASVPRILEGWICLYVQYFCYGPKVCLTSLKKTTLLY